MAQALTPILLDSFGNPIQRQRDRERDRAIARSVKLQFEAARTTRHNEKSFAHADNAGPVSYLNPAVRAELRRRARFEHQNSPYCFGMVTSLADDTVGSGPRLQVEAEDPDFTDDAEIVEELFSEWAEEVDFAGKLHTMRGSKAVDGESFALLRTNYALESPVKLDFKPIESEMVCSPALQGNTGLMNDGIILDDFGNVSAYVVLRRHPGDTGWGLGTEYDIVAAREVIHLFDAIRPGQIRGVCEYHPAIHLYEELRRYEAAVRAAAETAADHAAVFETTAQPDDEDEDAEPYDEIELAKRMGIFLPKGWKLSQMQAVQPTTTYDSFTACIIRQIGRCLQMPFHVASGDASKYNYSSARLDDKTYQKRIRNQRELIRRKGLKRLFARWWEEARLIPGLLPEAYRGLAKPPVHSWRWDGDEHIDPTKDASGDEINLRINATSLAEIHSKKGTSWEKTLRQRARELALQRDLGLIPSAPVTPAAPVAPDAAADPVQEETPADE